MTFPYTPGALAVPALPGVRAVRSHPIVAVAVFGPSGSWPIDGLLDSAADDTVFPESVAQRVGLDLTNAPVRFSQGVHAGGSGIRFARVKLRIADHLERREWETWVGFAATRMNFPLLGQAGFLQFFTAAFFGDREVAELTVNAAYPGI
jgi:hypothetical protein